MTDTAKVFTAEHCWPKLTDLGLDGLLDKMFSDDCPRCGHLVVLHSKSRGCVACEIHPRDLYPGQVDAVEWSPEHPGIGYRVVVDPNWRQR